MSLQYLQLPIQDLEQRLTQELAENPFLDLEEVLPEETPPEEMLEDRPGDDAEAEALSHYDAMENEIAEYMDRGAAIPPRSVTSEGASRRMEALDNAPAHDKTLQEHLNEQLSLMGLAAPLRDAVAFLIDSLDNRGYRPYHLLDLAGGSEDETLTPELLARALEILQSMDPPGVGARDLSECLLLQLDPDAPHHALARRIVSDHLEELGKNQLPKIMRALGAALEEVKDAVAVIGRLNPRPGALFNHEETHYVVPDVVVEEIDGRFEVRLEEDMLPPVMVSSAYRRLLRGAKNDPSTLQMLRRKFESAKWVVASIEQRRMTLYNVARALVDEQQHFMRDGVDALKPMRMQEIGDKLGIHVSTVGRALSGKYMQTPRGVFAMKYFFTGGTTADDGQQHSWRSVKQRIEHLIESENKRKPLSDEEIVEKLRGEGLDVARRTVAKYRIGMNIPSSRKRKEF